MRKRRRGAITTKPRRSSPRFTTMYPFSTAARGAQPRRLHSAVSAMFFCPGNEAHLALKEQPGKFEIVYPSNSILAEPPVALLDKNVDRHGTRKVAEAYLQFLYSKPV